MENKINRPRFEIHSHTDYSNIRLRDSINRVPDLIDRAYSLGLKGITISDHEILSSHVKANQLQEDYEDFTIALGNEIYLINERDKGQKYFHFILIAKNKTGYRALRELSSNAWLNSYWDGPMERVPTLKSELTDIIKKYPGSLIGTSACLRWRVINKDKRINRG